MKTKTIIVADDESIIALDIITSLRKHGVGNVLYANNGRKVKEILRSIKADLVILDIMMEHCEDGLETADHIIESYGIPIIFLTASTDPDTLAKAQIRNPLDIIIKPFSEHQLKNLLKHLKVQSYE